MQAENKYSNHTINHLYNVLSEGVSDGYAEESCSTLI